MYFKRLYLARETLPIDYRSNNGNTKNVCKNVTIFAQLDKTRYIFVVIDNPSFVSIHITSINLASRAPS